MHKAERSAMHGIPQKTKLRVNSAKLMAQAESCVCPDVFASHGETTTRCVSKPIKGLRRGSFISMEKREQAKSARGKVTPRQIGNGLQEVQERLRPVSAQCVRECR